MTKYLITVRYRTNSSCNTKDVFIEADNVEQALALASDKVGRQRGVIRIDGGEWHACREPTS
jgi:hypothetical protein